MELFRITKQTNWNEHNMVKNPNWKEATSRLFTSVAKDFISGQLRAVIKSRGPGISSSYYECGPRLSLMENKGKLEPKETPRCLIPRLLVVFTQQLEILTTTLTAVNKFSKWPEWDLNQGPLDCESDASTTLPHSLLKVKSCTRNILQSLFLPKTFLLYGIYRSVQGKNFCFHTQFSHSTIYDLMTEH